MKEVSSTNHKVNSVNPKVDYGIINEKMSFESEDAAIDYLAKLLVEGFLEIKRNERTKEHRE